MMNMSQSVRLKLLTKCCLMKQNDHFQKDLVHFENEAMPLSFMSIFQISNLFCKSATTTLPTRYVLKTIKTFQNIYCFKFHFKKHQDYWKLESKVS